MFQWLWMNGNLICCFHVKYIIGDHSCIIKCWIFFSMCHYIEDALVFTYPWVNTNLIWKYFNMLERLRKRGADTVTAFGGIPVANVLNICWHGSPLLDDTGGFSSHRCLQMWQSKASSTQSGLSREKPVRTTCEGEDGHKYLIIASDGIKSNQIESK